LSTSGGRLVGIVRLRIKGHRVRFFVNIYITNSHYVILNAQVVRSIVNVHKQSNICIKHKTFILYYLTEATLRASVVSDG
jgi:hypothetical protein